MLDKQDDTNLIDDMDDAERENFLADMDKADEPREDDIM